MYKRTKLIEHAPLWYEAEIEITGGSPPRLYVRFGSGRILSRAKARAEAREYWISYFDENPSYLTEMNRANGRHFRSSRGAADYVLSVDGDFHGLDVHSIDVDRVFLEGNTDPATARFFPQFEVLLPHVSKLRAECPHQRERGESYYNQGSIVCPDCGWKAGHGWFEEPIPGWIWAYLRLTFDGLTVEAPETITAATIAEYIKEVRHAQHQ